jgi:hypothetical protein
VETQTAVTPEPIVIYRSANRDGETFALAPQSRRRLSDALGTPLPANTRVFIGHDTKFDYQHVHGAFAPQVVTLLTGVSEGDERLQALGGVIFRDPVTDEDLSRTT